MKKMASIRVEESIMQDVRNIAARNRKNLEYPYTVTGVIERALFEYVQKNKNQKGKHQEKS
jgi:hypothetical protein